MNTPAIAIFAFNRPDHLKSTLESLVQCNGATGLPVYFFADGPRNDSDVPQTTQVRKLIADEKRFKSKTVIEQPKNIGLSKSIIRGVAQVLEKHPQVIVLEDDINVSPDFLPFMLEGLKRYEGDERVASICGYMYPIQTEGLPQSFFLKGTDCWGWATWRRAWKYFEPDGKVLLNELQQQHLKWDFDVSGSYPYTRMLKKQISGKNDSWAIRWHASAYLRGMVSLFPAISLVRNTGFDGSGTHCGAEKVDFLNQSIQSSAISQWPDQVFHHELAQQRISVFHRQHTSKKFRLLSSFRFLFERKIIKRVAARTS